MARRRKPKDELRPWPADKIERWPLSKIIPYERNPRVHDEVQIEQIAASMRRFGVTAPVLVDEKGVLIYGHGRRMAAEKLGLAELPVAVAVGWSEDEKRAYRIADNQLGLTSTWDEPLLRVELGQLKLAGFDLPVLGFPDLKLAQLLADENGGNTDPDDVPDLPVNPIGRVGDLWNLGRHRLLCGDSTRPEDVGRVLASIKPHLMVTDPPYGVEYDPDWRNRAMRADGSFIGARAVGKVQNDDRADWLEALELFPGCVVYVWHGALHAALVAQNLERAGFVIRAQIIWEKQHFIIGRGDYHWQHEPCWYAVRKGATGHWAGNRKQSTIWQIHSQIGWESVRPNNEDKASGHGAQKPVECMKRPIENNSLPGQAIYDPFVGSGTTIIAAEMTGRACHAIDVDPVYVDVAIMRWQEFVGAKAILDGDGRDFETVAAERRGGPKTRGRSRAARKEARELAPSA